GSRRFPAIRYLKEYKASEQNYKEYRQTDSPAAGSFPKRVWKTGNSAERNCLPNQEPHSDIPPDKSFGRSDPHTRWNKHVLPESNVCTIRFLSVYEVRHQIMWEIIPKGR